MMLRRAQQLGFTLIELIVAVGLMALLLTLLSSVFNQTQQAISRGKQTSEVIGASRASSQQFFADAKRMLLFEDEVDRTAQTPGFLVIIQETRNVSMPPAQRVNVPRDGWDHGTQIRSDQIAFFVDAAGMESLAPGATDRFDSDARARYARLWYGHGSREVGEDIGSGPNVFVTDLSLARQAALLIGPADTPPDGAWAGSIYADATALTLADRVYNLANTGVSGNFFHGVSDAIRIDYPGLFDDTTGVYGLPGTAFDATGEITTDYKRSAVSWAFPDPTARLVADPSVAVPFPVEDVGQTHAVFMPYVSDFAIEFAADITDDDSDGLPDGEPDTYDVTIGAGTEKAIKWYTGIDANPDFVAPFFEGDNDHEAPITWPIPDPGDMHSSPLAYPPSTTYPGSGVGFVFGHTGDDTVLTPPPTGAVEGAGKWWPYLIRIRYRVHDSQGDFSSIDAVTGDPVPGRWFEQIIPIPR